VTILPIVTCSNTVNVIVS